MLAFINFLLCLALGLAGFAAGTPFPDVLDSRNASSPSESFFFFAYRMRSANNFRRIRLPDLATQRQGAH